MKELLVDKNILVTGASSGIGRAITIFCIEQGAKVVITGRDKLRLEETRSMTETPSHCYPVICDDLSDVGLIKTLFQQAVENVGPLDGVVHSAGIAKLIPLQIVSEENYDEHFNIHVKASVFIAKEFQKKKNHNSDGSSLVFISSVSAYHAAMAQSLYAASKAGQIGLTKTLAIEMVAKNVRVNAIAPADVNTEMSKKCLEFLTPEQYEAHKSKHPMGLGSADDVAYGAAFLLSDYSKWINGTTLFVDGGFSAA